MKEIQILVTGVGSGLGKSISNIANVVGLNRDNRGPVIKKYSEKGVDKIIHCAFGAQGGYEQYNIDDYYKYVDDNILLTRELLKNLFIFPLWLYTKKN